MPPDEGLRLHNGEGLSPIEPAREPDEGEASAMRSASRLNVTFLVQGQLFAQKEVFCRECRGRTETEPEEAQGITQEHQQCTRELYEMME
jgi:hypothetical protein